MEKLKFGDVALRKGTRDYPSEEFPLMVVDGDDLAGCYHAVLIRPDGENILGSVPYSDDGGLLFVFDDETVLDLIEEAMANTIKEECSEDC